MPRLASVAIALLAINVGAADRYVWQDSPNPGDGHAAWDTAAHSIQDAWGGGICSYAYSEAAQLIVSNSVIRGNQADPLNTVACGGGIYARTDGSKHGVGTQIEGVTGIELVGTLDVDEKSIDYLKTALREHKLDCASIIPDLFGQRCWGKGALASADASIRRQAVEAVNPMTDIAVELGGTVFTLQAICKASRVRSLPQRHCQGSCVYCFLLSRWFGRMRAFHRLRASCRFRMQ